MFILLFFALAFSIEPDFCTCADSCTFAYPEFECEYGVPCEVPHHNEPSNRTCGFKIASNLLVTPTGEFYELMCQKHGLILEDLPEHGSCIDYSVTAEDLLLIDWELEELREEAARIYFFPAYNDGMLEKKNELVEKYEATVNILKERKKQEKLEKEENCVFACPVKVSLS